MPQSHVLDVLGYIASIGFIGLIGGYLSVGLYVAGNPQAARELDILIWAEHVSIWAGILAGGFFIVVSAVS